MTAHRPTPPTGPAARLAYLDQVAALAWPGARRAHRPPREQRSARDLLIAPSAAAPRLLLPAGSTRAATVAAGSHGAAPSLGQRVQRRALAVAVRCGLADLVLPDRLLIPAGETITDHLAAVLGRPVLVAMPITPPRANRKPVLHLLDADGQSIGFAKIGVDPLTSALVAREATVLQRLEALTGLPMTVPRALYHGSWNGLEILVQSPLPIEHTTPASPTSLTQAMRALAAAGLAEPPAAGFSYAGSLRDRATTLLASVAADDREALNTLGGLIDRLAASGRGDALTLGGWHGDWSPWNSGSRAGRLYVWDWERATGPVPYGYDELHYRLQRRLITDRVPHRDAARQCIDDAPAVLAGWEIAADDARMTAALYLCDIALRYIADGQRAAGGYGGSVETWILPALADYLPAPAS